MKHKLPELPKFLLDPNPEIYLSDNYLTLDVETTNLDKGSALTPSNTLILACWHVGAGHGAAKRNGGDYHCRGDEFSQHRLLEHIASADFVVAHFTKFELQWLTRCGVNPRSVLPYCTLLGEYVIQSNRRVPLDLDSVSGRYGVGRKAAACAALVHKCEMNPADIPEKMLLEYCQQDVTVTDALFTKQRRILKDRGLLPVAFTRNIVTPALADMEQHGMALDAAAVVPVYQEYTTKHSDLLSKLQDITGGINPRSGKQMREHIYGKLGFRKVVDHRGNPVITEGGKDKTDKATLHALVAKTPEQIAFKQLATEISKLAKPVENLGKMMKVLKAGGSTVYASYNQAVTQTHRLSSSGRKGGFQFQNFDRAFKPLFTVRNPGWQLVEGDAPQLEFRIAADLGNDREAKAMIRRGEDVHAMSAKVMRCSRQDAKKDTFGPLYGKISGTPRQQAYFEAFRKKYKDIYATQVGWTHEVLKTGELKTPWGLTFYFPGTKLKEGGYITNTPSIFNYPIQSFATADIIPMVLALVWYRMTDIRGMLVNTIHDSIVAEIHPSDVDAYKGLLIQSFTNDIYPLVKSVYGMTIDVPLGVGIKSGTHWGAGEETKFEPREDITA